MAVSTVFPDNSDRRSVSFVPLYLETSHVRLSINPSVDLILSVAIKTGLQISAGTFPVVVSLVVCSCSEEPLELTRSEFCFVCRFLVRLSARCELPFSSPRVPPWSCKGTAPLVLFVGLLAPFWEKN